MRQTRKQRRQARRYHGNVLYKPAEANTENVALLAFNRGLVDPKALARVDIDRTRLSASLFNNFLPSTQGSMRLRPGTKYLGSSHNDSGAAWIEFVAATDDTALLELTANKMRVWIDDALLGRPAVGTTLSLSDTGWDLSIPTIGSTDSIPAMTDYTTGGVTMSATSDYLGAPAWRAADDISAYGGWGSAGVSSLPAGLKVDFGAGKTKKILSYSVQAAWTTASGFLSFAPSHWRLLGSQHDTGTYATDTGKWALEDEQTGQTGWAVSERRNFTLTDTGTAGSWRHWQLYVIDDNSAYDRVHVSEFELFAAEASTSPLVLNAASIGAVAKVTKCLTY